MKYLWAKQRINTFAVLGSTELQRTPFSFLKPPVLLMNMLYKDKSGAAWTEIRFCIPVCRMACLNCLTCIVTQLLLLLLWIEHTVPGHWPSFFNEYLENVTWLEKHSHNKMQHYKIQHRDCTELAKWMSNRTANDDTTKSLIEEIYLTVFIHCCVMYCQVRCSWCSRISCSLRTGFIT